jgi:hypothetical protein
MAPMLFIAGKWPALTCANIVIPSVLFAFGEDIYGQKMTGADAFHFLS